ncbi:MAG TPA: molybdopterin-dependent oxidoreductase [Pirellulaceae bacterium]|nr:molybdopterin-dependent oxidoreductase [Pirellulaceae bacterium]
MNGDKDSGRAVLPPGQQLAAPGKWPLVGERLPAESAEPCSVEIGGLVERPVRLSLEDLQRLPQVEAEVDIHCVTRWSQPGMRFGGVTLQALLELAGCQPGARFVSFVARSSRQHSTSLVLEDAVQLGTLVALSAGGQPLPTLHGGPVRTVVPGRYFYKSLKWLTRIELLAEDRLGYWEAVAGYHNHADPWQEQRFIASSISRHQAAELIASHVFRGDLRGIDCRGRDLANLQAAGALLRDADFREAALQGADFNGANLSISKFQQADLRQASFRDADCEGCDFSGADLRGADFRGATLFGATLVDHAAGLAAKIDASTRFDRERLGDLTPVQLDFILQSPAVC